ncbi:MAG: oligosaccharide flippase family protein [cyanobacterium endosymbiont of Rhopalodia yunnanensis]
MALVGGGLRNNIGYLLEASSLRRFAWEKESFKEFVSFGRWIFVSTLIFFLTNQADKLLLGKFLYLKVSSIYTVAFLLTNLSKIVAEKMSLQVIFTLIDRINSS